MSVATQTARWHAAAPGGRTLLKITATLHRLLYRTSGGRLGRTLHGAPILLLTTTGRKTGWARTCPLCYFAAGDDLILIASAGGAGQHPDWYLNLRTNPRVQVQRGERVGTMIARGATGDERARLWARAVERYPVCAAYQRKTIRAIPIVVLHPAAPNAPERMY